MPFMVLILNLKKIQTKIGMFQISQQCKQKRWVCIFKDALIETNVVSNNATLQWSDKLWNKSTGLLSALIYFLHLTLKYFKCLVSPPIKPASILFLQF